MVKEQSTDREERLEKFLQAVEEAQKFQDDLLKYGLEAVHLYVEDVEGDWLEKWQEDEELAQFRYVHNPLGKLVVNLTMFLKSDDSVAVRVRQRLGDDSLLDVATELEKCLSIPEENEQICAVKKILAGSITPGVITRNLGDEGDEIELLDLAKDLLDKLVKIIYD
jgi:hypothetical protein